MFTMPSLWNLIVSTIVFFIAAWYLHRYLEEQGFPKGTTRSMLALVVASLLSWGSGYVVDRVQEKTGMIQPDTPGGLSEVMKDAGQVKTQP